MKKLIKLALLVVIVAAIYQVLSKKKAEWQGLSEAEVRAKLDRMSSRIPEDKLEEITEKVVATMRDRGMLVEAEPAAVAADVAAEVEEAVEDAVEEVSEAIADDVGESSEEESS